MKWIKINEHRINLDAIVAYGKPTQFHNSVDIHYVTPAGHVGTGFISFDSLEQVNEFLTQLDKYFLDETI